MNYELIQNLAYEAEDEADRLVNKGSEFHSEYNLMYTLMLSKLILNECITVLNKRFMGDLNREDMEVKRCVEDIKKHFGVEE